jgi:hypothetical protein
MYIYIYYHSCGTAAVSVGYYMCVCLYVCMHVCMYVCMYIYIYGAVIDAEAAAAIEAEASSRARAVSTVRPHTLAASTLAPQVCAGIRPHTLEYCLVH